MRILVTGSAGFIGYHLAKSILQDPSFEVIGLDNLNDYYDVSLKKTRLLDLENLPAYKHHHGCCTHKEFIFDLFERTRPDAVVHLAAQPGVRYSIEHPFLYTQTNIEGFLPLLEACRRFPVSHFLYASSSSVYGGNTEVPYSETQSVDHPISLYAATKRANELMAHTYSHLYGIPSTGLRFFTVYGPWGRPDMAIFLFADAIIKGKVIKLFNNGQIKRDYTYVGDIVESVIRLINKPPKPHDNPSSPTPIAPYRILNVGNSDSIPVNHFIEIMEELFGKIAPKEFAPMQPGDMEQTYADTKRLQELIGFVPATPVREGLKEFVTWYRSYYQV